MRAAQRRIAELACTQATADIGACLLRACGSDDVALWCGCDPFWRMPRWITELVAVVELLARPLASPDGSKARLPSFQFGQILAVPIFRAGAVVGAVGVGTKHARVWPLDARDAIERVARSAGAGADTPTPGASLPTCR